MVMENGTNVNILDIKMSFTSMVVFMVKWAVAAIPAMLILMIAGGIGTAIFGGIFAIF